MVLYGVTCHYSRLFLKTSKESEQTHQLRGRHTDSSAQTECSSAQHSVCSCFLGARADRVHCFGLCVRVLFSESTKPCGGAVGG